MRYPEFDKHCRYALPVQARDIPAVLAHVPDRRACVQAGGNVGLWPQILAGQFEWVYTFEPEPHNYTCMVENVTAKNVSMSPQPLSRRVERIAIGFEDPTNCGSCYSYHDDEGLMSTTIDTLDLDVCDLIWLDVEGWEVPVLEGAAETIERCLPVVVAEDKGLHARYDTDGNVVCKPKCDPSSNVVAEYMELYGYTCVGKVGRDAICVPSRSSAST